jgi:hypothetical protein
MGGASTKPSVEIEYKEDRAGVYYIEKTPASWKFVWSNPGYTVATFKNGRTVSAHLLSAINNKKIFELGHDGHIDIKVQNGTIEIENVSLKTRGICSEAVSKCLFASIRMYSALCGERVTKGVVVITSSDAVAAYKCYMKAFKKNGFEPIKDPKITVPDVKDQRIEFRRSIDIIPILF